MEFWWIICGIFLGSWTGLDGFGFWERRFISTRNTKKLMWKNELVQGWPRNGVQIRKLQNTEDLGKALQITESWLNLDLKVREICWGARNIQKFLVSPNLNSCSSSDFPSPLHFQAPTKNFLCPLIRSWQQNHEQILGTGKTMTQKLEMSWTTRHYSSLKAKLTKGLTDYSLLGFPLAILQFFALNHQTESDKGFSWFFRGN